MDLRDLFTGWAENYERFCPNHPKTEVALLIRWVEKNYAPVTGPCDWASLDYCVEEPEGILRQEFTGCCPEATIIEAAQWLGDPAAGWISKAEMCERIEEE